MLSRVTTALKRSVWGPRPKVSPTPHRLRRLGSAYGGWHFLDRPELKASIIVSCGLGEDASFDVEFAREYEATVVIVDPTPRAVQHFEALIERAGRAAEEPYAPTGNQPPGAYDLHAVTRDQLRLVQSALWTVETRLKFFEPANAADVSHSIVDYQHGYAKTGGSIDVETVTLATLIRDFGITSLPLLKIDIEGAEVPILLDMLSGNLRPAQILVEFDELRDPSRAARDRFLMTDAALRQAGYVLPFWDGKTNCLYVTRAAASGDE